jgi:hypothetical protein
MADFKKCVNERIVDLAVGLFLVFFGFFLTVIGLTIIPPFGLLLAVPVFYLSYRFLAAPNARACYL